MVENHEPTVIMSFDRTLTECKVRYPTFPVFFISNAMQKSSLNINLKKMLSEKSENTENSVFYIYKKISFEDYKWKCISIHTLRSRL